MGFGLTNATKAVYLSLFSALLNLAILFGFPITSEQAGGLALFVDACLIAWIAFTFKDSPKRLPEGMEIVEEEDAEPKSG